jgi:cytochrome-b5 reductase
MSLLTRFTQNRATWVPVAVGSAAIAASLYYSQIVRAPIANESKVAFKGDDQWTDLKLVKAEVLSSDTKRYTFALPDPDQVSGLVTASLLLAKYVTPKGSNVVRPYTPVSDHEQKGTIEFVIKTYPNGKFGNHIQSLKENDTVSFKGPITKFKYEANQYKDITLIGGGSGITPLYQLLHEITKNPTDKTKVHLIYGNKTAKDILLKKELDEVAAKHPDQVKLTYFLDKADEGVKAEIGYITKDWLKSNIVGPESTHKIYVCGPSPLYNALSGNKVSPTDQGELTGALKELDYTKDIVYKY